MDLIKEAFKLKSEGLNNTQIANELGIRRQDLVVIFKYLKNINPKIFDDLEEINSLKRKYQEQLFALEMQKKLTDNEAFLLRIKEDEVKKKQKTILELSDRLKECESEKSEYEKKFVEIAKNYEEAKQKFIDEINDLIEEKEKIIKDLENKLKKCKPIKCYLARTINFVFIFLMLGTLATAGYFAFNVKKEVAKRLDYNYVCYGLGNFESLGIKDYKYQFCYYQEKKNK